MRKSKKLLVALLSVSFAFAALGAVATTATTSSQRYVSAAAEETAAIDVTKDVTMTEEEAYRTAYKLTAVNISLGGKNLLPKDASGLVDGICAAYIVNDHVTNGMDWAEYIYINDVSVRSVLTANEKGTTSFKHSKKELFPMNLGGKYAPVCIQCDSNQIKLKIMQEYADFNSFSLTVKAGLTWENSSGETLTVTKDVTYDFESGTLAPKVERTNVSINDVFSVRASTVTTKDSKIYTIDADSNFFTEGGDAGIWLMDHYTDVQNYIFVNGKSVAEINKDTDDSSYTYKDFPGTLGNAYAVPIRVNIGSENGKTRLNVYIHNEYLKANSVVSIGLKAGFSTKDDKNIYQVTEDRVFYAHDGKYLRQCSVTFDGGEAKTAYIGATLPAKILPATPSKDATETIAYTFDGWYVGEKKFDVEKDVVTGDMALVAKFTESARKYSVTYNKEDGTEYQTVEVANGETFKLIDVPEKIGYTGVWSGETFDKMPTKDIVYTASYTAIEYKVTFKADGQTVGTDTYTVEDKTITEPSVPEKTGYTGVWETYELTTGDVTVNAVYTAIPQEPSSEPTESGSDETPVTSENTSESGSDETPVTSENTSGSEEKDKGGCGSVASVLGVSGALALAGVVTALKKKKEE